MAEPVLLDLRHLGSERAIGVYLLETPDGPALFDCGPATTLETLREELAARGVAVGDLRHLLLSHIHFDHAGAAGHLAAENPALTVHVSEIGAPHLVDPSRLEGSARRLYGDAFDMLWGTLVPVPAARIAVTGERVLDFDSFPSPGHARHHVCYLRDGILYAGDSAGVRIGSVDRVVVPAPPPEIDVEAWERTIDEIERRGPERLALVHFGVVGDVGEHLASFRERLRHDSELVAAGATEEEFTADARATLGPEPHPEYAIVPPGQCYQGLVRYWQQRREREAE
jgi:glyoxylase-like metal-dependent hydrolase (beta-lactamase superfamily II)